MANLTILEALRISLDATKSYVDTAVSTKVDKVAGKDLSTNDLTDELKSNYDAAYAHSISAHAPADAQKNSDITKAEIEAKLTGDITTHTHSQYLTEHQSLDDYALKIELHTHDNKSVLDGITAEKVAAWDSGTGSGSGSTAADYGPYSIQYNSENNRLEFIYTPAE